MSDDLISRQAAIDAIRASAREYTGFMEMEMCTDDDAVENEQRLMATTNADGSIRLYRVQKQCAQQKI